MSIDDLTDDDAKDNSDEAILARFNASMGFEGMRIRRDFLELAIQSKLDGDPIDIAKRFLLFVLGDQFGPRGELLEEQPGSNGSDAPTIN